MVLYSGGQSSSRLTELYLLDLSALSALNYLFLDAHINP